MNSIMREENEACLPRTREDLECIIKKSVRPSVRQSTHSLAHSLLPSSVAQSATMGSRPAEGGKWRSKEEQVVQRSAERRALGCVNAAGKARSKWFATAGTKSIKPLAEPSTNAEQMVRVG